MKCDSCKFNGYYTTGRDEYPGLTTIPVCRKGHWENNPTFEGTNDTLWDDCKDYRVGI